jgi:hypothetical protein
MTLIQRALAGGGGGGGGFTSSFAPPVANARDTSLATRLAKEADAVENQWLSERLRESRKEVQSLHSKLNANVSQSSSLMQTLSRTRSNLTIAQASLRSLLALPSNNSQSPHKVILYRKYTRPLTLENL